MKLHRDKSLVTAAANPKGRKRMKSSGHDTDGTMSTEKRKMGGMTSSLEKRTRYSVRSAGTVPKLIGLTAT